MYKVVFPLIFLLLLSSALAGCASGTPQAKSSEFCTKVSDKIPNNEDISALQAYNTCMEMELDKRNRYRDDSDAAVDIALGLIVDLLSS